MLTLAYIDPGTGSIVLQLLLAATVGVAYRFRRAIGRLIDRFRSR
jgi:hypothetical protein